MSRTWVFSQDVLVEKIISISWISLLLLCPKVYVSVHEESSYKHSEKLQIKLESSVNWNTDTVVLV